MRDHTTDLLDKLARLDVGDHVRVTSRTSDENTSRRGSYIQVQRGLSVSTYFVGVDPRTEERVVELVG